MEQMMTRKIRVKPDYLGRNLLKNIQTQLENEVVNTCTEETGYILKIISIDKVIDNCIENSSSDIILEISKCPRKPLLLIK